ncbi:hypothetical protein N7532_008527 [Penicillium argentinense]|uniref:Uncharacterized protein n=1 Tax=Penicillium argentinense TaxID=1131581 RepID=A0A9W9EXH5_9EURO|nr:uncharacterized protein N7532_008527 [Penicillium argentinense]KAJ5089843.1 hypothetical protein N7532_008527 [Penicillium argentinense]
METTSESGLGKRWFGKFVDWLKKINTVEAGNDGFLNTAFQKGFLLYRAVKGCARRTFYAEMMYLDADIQMDATYAYYLSGTIVPLEWTILTGTWWKKLIDTLSYPGLSIKGIATVGPSLDIYGRIRGSVTLSGHAKAGARVHFGRAELYFPQDEEGTKCDKDYDKISDIKSQQQRPKTGLEPQFFASAQASANLAIDVSPNAKIGIEVGPSVLGKGNLVNAQIIAFLNSTLDFSATVTGSVRTGTSPTYCYKYGAYLYYNLGYGGFATWNWHFTPIYLYSIPGQKYTIYENSNVESDATLNSNRDVKIMPANDEKGIFHDDDDEDAVWDDGGLEPYVPPASHVHHRRSHMHLHHKLHDSHHEKANATTPIPDMGSVIFKRADDDGGKKNDTASSSKFSGSQKFSCPKSGNKEPTLPELRYWEPTDPERNRYCTKENKKLNQDAGATPEKRLISCDEFPFGGAGEGGEWGPNTDHREGLQLQIACLTGSSRCREIATENSDRTLGYNFTRNFTMALAYATSLSDTPDQWGKMALQDFQIKTYPSESKALRVLCAVNLFNHPDVYRYAKSGNGYCYDTRKGMRNQAAPTQWSKRSQDEPMEANDA